MGRHPLDHPKTREKNLKARYGLTIADFEALLENQGGLCAICREHLTHPQVDHCHASGAVRGLLCPDCNVGIARLREDPRIIHAALAYVVRHSSHRIDSYAATPPADSD